MMKNAAGCRRPMIKSRFTPAAGSKNARITPSSSAFTIAKAK